VDTVLPVSNACTF